MVVHFSTCKQNQKADGDFFFGQRDIVRESSLELFDAERLMKSREVDSATSNQADGAPRK
eukprot:6172693-Pleurochrysis_carterae.AAC.4